MRIVLFLGAGFSAPFNLPVMDTFLHFAANSRRITDEDKNFIKELTLDARKANSFLQSRPTNLEDILSFAVMGDRLGLTNSNNVERLPKIKHIIQKIYTQISDVDAYWNKYHPLKSFLGFDPRKPDYQLSVITTNYDLNIESALRFAGVSVNPSFNFRQCEGIYDSPENLYTSHGIPLYKLHGSVNWYEDNKNKDSFLVEGKIVTVMGDKSAEASLPLVCTDDYKNKYTPIIIPPSFLKPEFSRPISQIWAGAANALEEAQILSFVGYSFPPTDIEMKYFLAKALVNNVELRKIMIIDKNANSIVTRLKDNGSGFGSHFKDLLVPIENNWTSATLEIND